MTSAAVEFDPFSADFFDDPYETYRSLRDHAPVYHHARYGFWALSRFHDVVAAHQDWRTLSSAHGVTLHDLLGPPPVAAGSIIYLDPPAHERLRNLVSRAFTPRAIAALEPGAVAIPGALHGGARQAPRCDDSRRAADAASDRRREPG